MKKWLFVTLFILLIGPVYAEETEVMINGEVFDLGSDVSIELNGTDPEFETPPYILKNRTVVPIKFIMDTLGYEVSWDGDLRKVTCTRGDRIIEMIINDPNILIDGELYESDVAPVIISNRTYVPLALITRSTGSEVNWINDTRTVTIEEKIEQLNVFYGPSSYKNFLGYDFSTNRSDSISYAWSNIDVIEGEVVLNTSSVNNNSMFVPKDFELVMTEKPSYLNIYNDNDYEIVFIHSEELIQSIKHTLQSPMADDPVFDGVVIDFENIPENQYENYLSFIEKLNETLSSDVKLMVAVQPRTFDYKRLLQSVDGMILMLHDYESKIQTIVNFNSELVYQPITPITSLKSDLDTIIEGMTVHEKSKIMLQLNLAVVQWQGESFYQVSRFTPGYNKLMTRMDTLTSTDFKYDVGIESPYIVYTDENNMMNTIWYENESSLQAKLDLIKAYDLGGASVWQMGNLPSEVESKLYELNLWEQILKNY